MFAALFLSAAPSLAQSADSTPALAPPKIDYLLPDLAPGFLAYDGKLESVRTVLVGLVDYDFFSQNSASLAQVGAQANQIEGRSFRTGLVGQIKFHRPWDYNFTLSYVIRTATGTQTVSVTFTDAWIRIPLWGSVKLRLGKQKEPFSYEMVGDAANLPQQERVLSPFFVSRNTGATLSGLLAGDRMTWTAGLYNSAFVWGEALPYDGRDVAGRVTGLVSTNGSGSRYLALGVDARWSDAAHDSMRFRGRPESNVASYFLDTGNFPANNAMMFGLDALVNEGPVSLLGEYATATVHGVPGATPRFYGYYFTGSWVVTGEHRPYDRNAGYARRIMPLHRGGAWEIVARFSHVDEVSGGLDGGLLNKWYAGVNWWASRQWKTGLGYGIARLEKGGSTTNTGVGLVRLQWIY